MRFPKNCKIEALADSDGGRFMLSHVWLDVEGARLIASDGKALVIVPVEVEEGDVTGPIPVEVIKAAKAQTKGPKDAAVILSCGEADLIGLGVKWPRPAKGEYPNFERVIPKDKAVIRFGVNVAYLRDLAGALSPDTGFIALDIPTKGASVKDGIVIGAVLVHGVGGRINAALRPGSGVVMPVKVPNP